MDESEHWDRVYERRAPGQVSWYRPHLERPLTLIEQARLPADAAIIDVGEHVVVATFGPTGPDTLLDRGRCFRDSSQAMSASSWRVRILAFLQLILVLPPMVSGSICISADGGERSEWGGCACRVPFVGTAEAAIGTPGTANCGPCRDEAFSAMRGAHPSAPHAPPPTSRCMESYLPAIAPHIADAQVFWSGEPPGRRLPILRC